MTAVLATAFAVDFQQTVHQCVGRAKRRGSQSRERSWERYQFLFGGHRENRHGARRSDATSLGDVRTGSLIDQESVRMSLERKRNGSRFSRP